MHKLLCYFEVCLFNFVCKNGLYARVQNDSFIKYLSQSIVFLVYVMLSVFVWKPFFFSLKLSQIKVYHIMKQYNKWIRKYIYNFKTVSLCSNCNLIIIAECIHILDLYITFCEKVHFGSFLCLFFPPKHKNLQTETNTSKLIKFWCNNLPHVKQIEELLGTHYSILQYLDHRYWISAD